MKAMVSILSLVVLWLVTMAFPSWAEPPTLTVDEVLAHPEIYEGKQVRVHGFVTFEFENNRLWRDEAAFRNYQPKQALWLSAPDLSQTSRDATKGRLAYVSGKFTAGEYRSQLTNLTSVQRDPNDHKPNRGWWSDPDFTALVVVLGALACASFALIMGYRAQRLSGGYDEDPRLIRPTVRQRPLKRR